MKLTKIISLLNQFKAANERANKADIESYFSSIVQTRKERSVYVGNNYAFRFSEANTTSFSNVVLSLSALQKYNDIPVVICIVRGDRLDFRLANASFLKRISHSSHQLRADNIRGSFLGHDIMDTYEGVPNRPEHFEELMALHAEFSWDENVERLVEATNSITARATRFQGTEQEFATILDAPMRAAAAIEAGSFYETEKQLSGIVKRHRGELLQAAALDNVNIRGNKIEQIITGEVNAHRLDDLTFNLNGFQLVVDIKTKLLDRASAPKAYNIDKMLKTLSKKQNVFAFFFIGLNASENLAHTRLVSIFDPVILMATRIQTHWAGRASRGVTQLTGDLSRLFDAHYETSVDVDRGKAFLQSLIER
jgi:hypothetical protein